VGGGIGQHIIDIIRGDPHGHLYIPIGALCGTLAGFGEAFGFTMGGEVCGWFSGHRFGSVEVASRCIWFRQSRLAKSPLLIMKGEGPA
jgi:hypothetical protein